MDHSRFKELVQYLKEQKYIRNQQDFVERVNSDKTTVSQIINGKIKIPNSLFAGIEQAFPFISIEWIKGSSDQMFIDPPLTSKQNTTGALVPLIPVTPWSLNSMTDP